MILMFLLSMMISQVGRSHEAAERRLRELQVARDTMMMTMMMMMMIDNFDDGDDNEHDDDVR